MKSSSRIAAVLVASFITTVVATGCAGDSESAAQDEIDALRADLDQLANAVGRLEFRIYELENFHPAADGAVETAEVDDGNAKTSDEDNGLIDLTPVD